ncbi:MAG: hypothetical protein ACQEW2_05405 [Bacillota bacterium]|uniref:hypothetical protein n=1 Tax=Cytobacillus firmus TaxID=1399 RepID=UPI001F50DFE5|nr:hypothetical protein [Cytobacillus firmus]MED1941995.1 hypothetical protein [Cytobacillus firmus]MED4447909.1 hypothetical protein [Cytobacillus firmus]
MNKLAHIFISIFLLLSGLIPAVQQSQEPIDTNDSGRDAIVIDSPALKNPAFCSTLVTAAKTTAKTTNFKARRMYFQNLTTAALHRSSEYMTPYMFQSNYLRI